MGVPSTDLDTALWSGPKGARWHAEGVGMQTFGLHAVGSPDVGVIVERALASGDRG